MGFSRQECWSLLPFPSPEHLPDPGIKPVSLALQIRNLPLGDYMYTNICTHIFHSCMYTNMCDLFELCEINNLTLIVCPFFKIISQSCPTLCDPIDYSLPGSSVHEIFQARVLEWIAVLFSRGSSWPRDQTQVSRIASRFFTIWATGRPFWK